MSPWLDVLCIVVFNALGATVSYGVLKGQTRSDISALRRDMERMEGNVQLFVTRTEYESRHKDLRESLGRIESKVDSLAVSRNRAG